MPVQATLSHKHSGRGDCMDKKMKYDATYHYGKTTVHVVAPPPMTQEEIDKVIREFHLAGWAIINALAEKGIGEGEIWVRENSKPGSEAGKEG